MAQVNNQCCSSRPNQISTVHVKSHTLNNWFGGIGSDAKDADPAVGTFGNARPGSERAPGYQQYDMSLVKDFTIFRKNRLGLRVNAFNALNVTSLGNPNGNFDSGTSFGQITNAKSTHRQLTLSAKYQF